MILYLTKGIAHYREPLVRALAQSDGWISAVSAKDAGATSLYRNLEQAPWVHAFPMRWHRYGALRWFSVPTGTILRELKPSIVVAEFSSYMTSTWALALRRILLRRPRLVFHTHGASMERGRDGWRNRLLDRLRLLPMYAADAIACYSEEGRAYLAQHLPAERLFVARNTLDIAPMRAERGRMKPARRSAGPHLLATGRFTRDKRFPALIRLFRRFHKDQPEARLTLIGDGPDMAAVRREAGPLLDDGTILLPGLLYDEPDVAPHFLGADLFVVTGACGLSVNHALAYGLPVMAYERSADGPFHHPEIAYVLDGVTGYTVSAFTEDAMLERLLAEFARHPWPKERLVPSIDRYVDSNLTLAHLVDDFRRIVAYAAGPAGSAR